MASTVQFAIAILIVYLVCFYSKRAVKFTGLAVELACVAGAGLFMRFAFKERASTKFLRLKKKNTEPAKHPATEL